MAINYTYPEKAQAVIEDEVLIIDSTDKITRKTSIQSILALGTGGGGGGGVTSFQATDGSFIDFSPNTATSATVILTGDLSATGTASATTFLRGDNTWSTAITNVIGLDPISVTVAGGVATVSLGTFVNAVDGGTGLTALGTKSQVMAVNSGRTALEYVDQKVIETIEVNGAADVVKGDPLYILGWNNVDSRAVVGKADADNPSSMPCVGLAGEDIAAGQSGEMVVVGVLDNVATNTLPGSPNPGDILYVNASGGLTGIKPVGAQSIQNVGILLKRAGGLNGSIQVIAIGRTNDLPNIPQGNVWLGDSSGVPAALPIGGVGTVLTSNGTTASWSTAGVANYLPLAGGAMTGPITTNSTFDGRDVAADGLLATNALPKSGGTMTGSITGVSLVQLKEQALSDTSVDPAPTFDAVSGAYANINADAAITTFTINLMPTGITSKLFITTSAATSVVTWQDSNTASIIWAGGNAPVLSTSGVDIITFEFSQGLVYGSIIQNYS